MQCNRDSKFRATARSCVIVGAVTSFAALLPAKPAAAHCEVGDRIFPATLAIDDSCVMDELAVPNVAALKNGDDPSAREIDFPGEFSKRITETFGLSFASSFTRRRAPGGLSASGFQNLETAFKYQFVTDASSELVMSAGLAVLWGGLGGRTIGADRFTVLTPTLWFSKGLVDLPDGMSWARPFSITGQVGYDLPTWSRTVVTSFNPDSGDFSVEATRNPQFLVYGATLQYSLSYLQSKVANVGLPEMIERLVPIIETRLQTPVGNNYQTGVRTTGTINPGVFWVGEYFQVGAEAIIPINRASGKSVGWVVGIDIYLHELFPDSPLGRPLFAFAENETSARDKEGFPKTEHSHNGGGERHHHHH